MKTQKISAAAGPADDRFSPRFRDLCRFPLEIRTGGSKSVSTIRVDQPGHHKIVPGVPDIVLRLVQGGDIRNSTVERGGGPVALSGRRGSICVSPAGAEAV